MKRIMIFALIVISLVTGSTVTGFCAAKYRNYSLNLDAEKVIGVKLSAASYDKSYSSKYSYSTEDADEIEMLMNNINSMYVKVNKSYKNYSDDGVRYDLTIMYEDKSVIYSVVGGTNIIVNHTGGVKYTVNEYDFKALLSVFETLKTQSKTAAEAA
ncbi:MAG: hypothetical protein LUC92_06095 [Clostridiales bacterium]|nr:hypothetical protein [Clostridiales bacterium]